MPEAGLSARSSPSHTRPATSTGRSPSPEVVAEASAAWRADVDVDVDVNFVEEARNIECIADDPRTDHGSGGALSLREILRATSGEYAATRVTPTCSVERIDGPLGQ